jgi:hypothetical protein
MALLAALTLYLGWLGTADIRHHDFDLGAFLISGALAMYLSFKRLDRPAEKPE